MQRTKFLSSIFICVYVYLMFTSLSVGMYHMLTGVTREQRRALGPLELALRVFVSHLMWLLGLNPRSPERPVSTQVLSHLSGPSVQHFSNKKWFLFFFPSLQFWEPVSWVIKKKKVGRAIGIMCLDSITQFCRHSNTDVMSSRISMSIVTTENRQGFSSSYLILTFLP